MGFNEDMGDFYGNQISKMASFGACLGAFGASCFMFSLRFLFNDDGNISNFSNHFEMIDEFGNRTMMFKVLALVGLPLGCLLFGVLSDQFGRHSMIQYQLLLKFFCLFYSVIAFSTNILVYTCLFSGFAFESLIFTGFLHIFEISGDSQRIAYTALFFLASSAGIVVGPLFFYFQVDWRAFLVFCMIFCISGVKILNSSKKNTLLPGKNSDLGKERYKNQESLNDIWDVNQKKDFGSFCSFFNRNLKEFGGFVVILANSVMVYCEFNFFGARVIGDQYLDASFTGIVEIFAMVVVIGIGFKYDSNDFITVCIVFSRLLMISTYFFNGNTFFMIISIAVLKFAICLEIYFIYFYFASRVPAEFRGKMFGFCNFLGRTGGFLFCLFLNRKINEFYSVNLVLSIFSFTSLIPLSALN
jgi:MFS family permease